MEHENIDNAAQYREACENVKKIVKAIKAIKMKYYPNFARITEEDHKVYQQLEFNLDRIAQRNNLQNLKVALMGEVSAKYDKQSSDDKIGKENNPDDILQKCYGAIDVQQKALSQGKIKQAKRCQEELKQYMNEIDIETYGKLITEYKREKFAELGKSKDKIQEDNDRWSDMLKAFYKPKHTEKRPIAMKVISNASEKSIENEKQTEEEIYQ